MIVKPKIRGFICTTAHPDGCAEHIHFKIGQVRSKGPIENGPKRVLVIGASTGYGIASRIAAAFGCGSSTIGVFFEREGSERQTGTAGWYNTAAFEKEAKAAGLYARSFNGDAFSDEMKQTVIDAIKADLKQIDCVVYSLASPRRTHPKTGETFKSVLKPIGQSYTNKNLNTTTKEVNEVTIEPATQDEIDQTVAVMGGEDWEMWMDALQEAGVLADGVQTVSYSYIGPEVTWPIYTNGTIGVAKADLEATQKRLDEKLAAIDGKAWVVVAKAVVTQASSAIPVVPLYISLLYKVMKEKGNHEDTAQQMDRLFRERLYGKADPQPDEKGRIRIDDWEMEEDVQAAVDAAWKVVDTDNLAEFADSAGYEFSFLRLFGFGLDAIDYEAETDPTIGVPSIQG